MTRSIRPTKPPGPAGKVELDWKAYFVEFCKKHGEPVEFNGLLLFRDGWRYSATDYEGPEWPPPGDFNTLDTLVRKYWELRRAYILPRLDRVLADLRRFHEIKAAKSMPLRQVVLTEVRGPDGKRTFRRSYVPLNLAAVETKVEWFRKDLAECDERLAELARTLGGEAKS